MKMIHSSSSTLRLLEIQIEVRLAGMTSSLSLILKKLVKPIKRESKQQFSAKKKLTFKSKEGSVSRVET
jgi:hypothetical protein